MKFNNIEDIIEKSKDKAFLTCNESGNNSFEVENVKLIEDGVTYYPYEVYISYRDLLFLCVKANLNYEVGTIGFNDYLTLFSID